MRKQVIFVLATMFLFSGFVISQTKTVTNADLEKFRQKRLKAEKDLRENYREMGFDSPEEIAKQNEKSRRELNELANQLRQERIEREMRENEFVYLQNENYQAERNYSRRRSGFVDYGNYYRLGYYYPYRTRRYRNRGNRRFKGRRSFRQRFIGGMPDYVKRNHRFNRFDTRRVQKPKRRGITNRRRTRN